jgi:hypothetical protein
MASADHFLHGYGVCTCHWVQLHTYPFKIYNFVVAEFKGVIQRCNHLQCIDRAVIQRLKQISQIEL